MLKMFKGSMKIKLLEIRDRMTLIPAITIEISGFDGPLARHAGYGDRCILLARLGGGEIHFDPYDWASSARTMGTAHNYIIENWDSIENGQVICVETILGERTTPKESEVF